MRTTRLCFLIFLCGPMAACGPHGGGGHGGRGHGGNVLFGMHRLAMPLAHRAMRMGMRGARGGHNFRSACADDLAKLCANEQTRRAERRCLEGKRETLSAECKTALDARRNRNAQTTTTH